MVERSAFNRVVGGSSPSAGAFSFESALFDFFLLHVTNGDFFGARLLGAQFVLWRAGAPSEVMATSAVHSPLVEDPRYKRAVGLLADKEFDQAIELLSDLLEAG